MKKFMIHIAVILVLGTTATVASAECSAEYKAKRDNPLELYYDVALVDGDCTIASATEQLEQQLEAQGLTLLKVLSVKEE